MKNNLLNFMDNFATYELLIVMLYFLYCTKISKNKDDVAFKEKAKKVYLFGAITYVILTITYYAFTTPSMSILMIIEDIIIILTVIIVAKKTKKGKEA
jgi:hypothetical protein